jgi:alpha-L-rhamnosidase
MRNQASLRAPIALFLGSSLMVTLLLACGNGSESAGDDPVPSDPEEFEERAFAEPAMEHRPWVRWWWPGGAVDRAELEVEVESLFRAGFGGVEVQAFGRVFSPAELAKGVLTWGSPEFFGSLTTAGQAAGSSGMGFDVTLGSGWPASAPTIDEAPARQLVLGSVDVTGPATYAGALPPPTPEMVPPLAYGALGPFDENVDLAAVVAAEVIDADAEPPVLDHFIDVRSAVEGGGWSVPAGLWRVFAVYENQSRQLSDTAAYVAESVVVDHLRPQGAQELISEVGDPMLDAVGVADGVFVDSFELSAELPWTTGFLERFRSSKGYDPTPFLPLLFRKGGEPEPAKLFGALAPRFASVGAEERVREDYEDVRGAAFLEGHVRPLQDWATRRGVTLRLQAHGGFAHYLDSYAAVDIPESEGLAGAGTYDFLKLAASGAHVSGHRIVSSESFVGLISDPRGLTREDFFLLAGRAESAGITRLVYHGFAYRFVLDEGEPWYPFAGALTFSTRLDEEHPIWDSLPELNVAFARTAYALTRGRHVADVAWLHAALEHRGGVAAFGEAGAVPRSGESQTSRSILDAGLIYDRVSPAGLEGAVTESDPATGRAIFRIGAATYPALLIDDLEAASPELLAAIERLCAQGIPVVIVGELPTRARGWADHEARDEAVRASVERLASCVRRASAAEAGVALRAAGLSPAAETADGQNFPLSPERRTTSGGDIIFLFNESNADVTRRLRVTLPAQRLRIFDPERPEAIADVDLANEPTFELEVPARRSRLLVLDREPATRE